MKIPVEDNRAIYYYKILGNELYEYSEGRGIRGRWGMFLGGRWILDYTFKLVFDLSTEQWESEYFNIRTDKDLYAKFDELGIRWSDGNTIHWKGHKDTKDPW